MRCTRNRKVRLSLVSVLGLAALVALQGCGTMQGAWDGFMQDARDTARWADDRITNGRGEPDHRRDSR